VARAHKLSRACSLISVPHFRSLVLQRCVAAVLQVEEEKAATKGSKKGKKKK
jgi:hypothetical protein